VVQTSGNFFALLGTQPVLGRAFTPDDDVDASGWGLPGRNAVAVISYGLWQSLYGGTASLSLAVAKRRRTMDIWEMALKNAAFWAFIGTLLVAAFLG
jgi:hypothetical protein